MKSALDVLRSARAQPDKDSLFQRIADAGAGEPEAVIAAVRITKSVKPELSVTFHRKPGKDWMSGPLTSAEITLRNSILERAVTLAIHTADEAA